jgi:hypothetical protein
MSTAEQRASLIDVATGKIRHDDMGGCPDELTGWDSRDPECPACRVLMSSAPDGSDEPYGIVYEWDIGTSVVQRSFSPAPYNGREPDRCVTVYTRPASPQPAAGADEQDAVRALAAFGAAILNRMRRSWGNDIDGYDAEEMGLKAGVLVRQTIDEPCCETCECAEVADFPLECNRILTIALPILDAAIAAQEKQHG